MRLRARFALVIVAMVTPAFAAEGNYLYRAEMVQAAPGKFTDLLDLYAKQAIFAKQTGDAPPFVMRHSQGDRWDLLLIYPMASYGEYYSADRIAKRRNAEAESTSRQIQQDIAWREDLFLYGPAIDAIRAAFASAGFYHIEMLHALPARQPDLVKEREMESAYNQALGRPELFIFTRDAGAHFDVLSIDFYRDLKHYAESADIPAEKQQAAARAAGYTAPEQIGPFLRAIIADHHDTLAVSITPPQKK
jgi:hypothetical protein